jgi:hypothetical protein
MFAAAGLAARIAAAARLTSRSTAGWLATTTTTTTVMERLGIASAQHQVGASQNGGSHKSTTFHGRTPKRKKLNGSNFANLRRRILQRPPVHFALGAQGNFATRAKLDGMTYGVVSVRQCSPIS